MKLLPASRTDSHVAAIALPVQINRSAPSGALEKACRLSDVHHRLPVLTY